MVNFLRTRQGKETKSGVVARQLTIAHAATSCAVQGSSSFPLGGVSFSSGGIPHNIHLLQNIASPNVQNFRANGGLDGSQRSKAVGGLLAHVSLPAHGHAAQLLPTGARRGSSPLPPTGENRKGEAMETKKSVEIDEKELASIRHWLRAYDAAMDDPEKGIHDVAGVVTVLVQFMRDVVRKAER